MLAPLAMVLVASFAASSCSGQKLDRTCLKQSFGEEFDKPLSRWSETWAGERWRTRYFHSGHWPLGRGLGQNDGESQIYVDPEYLDQEVEPFEIRHGVLTIHVKPASPQFQAAVAAVQSPGGATPRFTSGLLTTENSLRQRYGYFEARIRVPNTPGAWPAFWLYEDKVDPHAEIDIMEILSADPKTNYVSVHGFTDRLFKRTLPIKGKPLDDGFHLFGALWTLDEVVFYRDEREVARIANPNIHRPMYMLLNVAMDGAWNKKEGHRAADDARADMQVDWVRAYTLVSGCATE